MPNTLKPGHIPDGWTKGDGLHVAWPESFGAVGMVVHAPRGLRKALTTDLPPGTVAAVKFRFHDTPEVRHWLAWWKGAH